MRISKKYKPSTQTHRGIPLQVSRLSAGFPSPADDFTDVKLDLNDHLIKHPSATFFVQVSGDSMTGAGIFDGDLLVVDRSLEPKNKSIIVAVLDGELTVKRLKKIEAAIMLVPENPDYDSIDVSEDADFSVWGVVVWVLHKA